MDRMKVAKTRYKIDAKSLVAATKSRQCRLQRPTLTFALNFNFKEPYKIKILPRGNIDYTLNVGIKKRLKVLLK